MRPEVMKKFLIAIAILLPLGAAAAAPGLSGTYTCSGDSITFARKIEFRSPTRVVLHYVSFNNNLSTFVTTYTIEGDFLYIKHDKGGEFSFKIFPGKLVPEPMAFVIPKDTVCTKGQ